MAESGTPQKNRQNLVLLFDIRCSSKVHEIFNDDKAMNASVSKHIDAVSSVYDVKFYCCLNTVLNTDAVTSKTLIWGFIFQLVVSQHKHLNSLADRWTTGFKGIIKE